ncbi:MAG: amidase [Halobacteriaceae archaeon]
MDVERHVEPLAAVAASLRSGERDPHEYVRTLLDRAATLDPEIRALCEEPDREERVRADLCATVERFDGGDRPPLYGVPVGVKDIVDVRGLLTRAGSDVPPTELTGEEASVVRRLREAGAVPMAKTVTTEFAYMAPGPTRNPHALAHTPGGSSSGSAAGVAAGLFPLAIGSQTGGSVLRPAAFCGVVGFKPTYDRIPTDGVVPAAPSLDTLGTFTQDVAGARLAASVLCDDWEPRDPADVASPVLGVPADAYLALTSETAQERFERHVDALEESGYDVRRTDLFADPERASESHQTLMRAEMALAHESWYAAHGDDYRPETAAWIAAGREESVGALAAARAFAEDLRAHVRETAAAAGVDCWVSPAAPGPAPEGLDDTGSSTMNRLWTYAGLPAVSVPAGTTDAGLPVGLQCCAGRMDGERLLAWAEGLRTAVDPTAGA